jgi:transcriptional accessory protein Tex/SPT6
VESPEAVLSVGDEVRVKVIDVDVSRRRISLSMRQVGGQPLQPRGTEIEAEADAEPAASTEPMSPAPDFADVEQAVEAAGEAPAEAAGAPAAAPPAEQTAAEPEAAAAEEDVSLESILADLKRREGRE